MTSILRVNGLVIPVNVSGQSQLCYSADGSNFGVLGDVSTSTYFVLGQSGSGTTPHYSRIACYLPNPHSGPGWVITDPDFQAGAHEIGGLMMGYGGRLPVDYPEGSTGGIVMRLVYDPDMNMAQTPVLWQNSWRMDDSTVNVWIGNDYHTVNTEAGQEANLWTALDTSRCRFEAWSEVRDSSGALVTFEHHLSDVNFEFPKVHVPPPPPPPPPSGQWSVG